ncbi:MAG: hypothetical protein H0X66_10910 [Verrucomicrobia bacterium]|nr:hypothetical protein [Verrucomicrobiota bacterium]
MHEPDLIELFVEPLNRAGFKYFVSGSVAAMIYGEPRVTHDIDLIVFLRPVDIARLPELFPSPRFYVPPQDVIAIETAREQHGHFNVIDTDSALKADFFTANQDELHVWAFRNLKQYSTGETTVSLAPPEYVILRKLEYYREGGSQKHLRDIRSMLSMSGDQVNRAELEDWIRRRGLQLQWKEVCV